MNYSLQPLLALENLKIVPRRKLRPNLTIMSQNRPHLMLPIRRTSKQNWISLCHQILQPILVHLHQQIRPKIQLKLLIVTEMLMMLEAHHVLKMLLQEIGLGLSLNSGNNKWGMQEAMLWIVSLMTSRGSVFLALMEVLCSSSMYVLCVCIDNSQKFITPRYSGHIYWTSSLLSSFVSYFKSFGVTITIKSGLRYALDASKNYWYWLARILFGFIMLIYFSKKNISDKVFYYSIIL